MFLLRYTVIDRFGGVSFVSYGDALDALLAACAGGARTVGELLELASPYYAPLREPVLNGLAIFDERNTPGRYDAIRAALVRLDNEEQPVFRVVDELTREASLRPARSGGLVFNLVNRRIVQIANTYRDVPRVGRARVVGPEGLPQGRTFSYRLPREWSIVP